MEPQRVAYETARLRLARYRLESEQSRLEAAAQATRVSAEALQVDRASVWLLKERDTLLTCVSLYQRSLGRHAPGPELGMAKLTGYARALRERRVIAASDACAHPYTRELAEPYLIPNRVASTLDAPIIQRGQVIGVVRHEQVGERREWTERELGFASSVADMVTLVFEQADRLELEAALQAVTEHRLEQQKMEALGRMARAVAHDFNNVLATVSMSLSTLKDGGDPDDELMAEVAETVELGRRLTRQLLTFGGSSDDVPVTGVAVAPVVDRMTPMLRSAIGVRVSLSLSVESPRAGVMLTESELEQVVLNLCLNARDAIEDRGTIQISVRDARESDEVAPDHVVLVVKDSGVGMDAATCPRIFEPFFTTKRAGTGLGLATVYGIVRRAGGVVRVESQPGVGTSMVIALPRMTQ